MKDEVCRNSRNLQNKQLPSLLIFSIQVLSLAVIDLSISICRSNEKFRFDFIVRPSLECLSSSFETCHVNLTTNIFITINQPYQTRRAWRRNGTRKRIKEKSRNGTRKKIKVVFWQFRPQSLIKILLPLDMTVCGHACKTQAKRKR